MPNNTLWWGIGRPGACIRPPILLRGPAAPGSTRRRIIPIFYLTFGNALLYLYCAADARPETLHHNKGYDYDDYADLLDRDD